MLAKTKVVVHVRHTQPKADGTGGCPKRKHGGFYTGCDCPKFLRYSFNGKQRSEPAKTRSWEHATALAKEKEAALVSGIDTAVQPAEQGKKTIADAVALYIVSKTSDGVGDAALAKNKRELERFEAFMAGRSRYYPADVRLEDLIAYRADWPTLYPSSQTRAMVQTRLRGFLRFCRDNKWTTEVPKLKAIAVDEVPTLPLSEKEYVRLLAAAKATPKAHALIQLMRHSGLAIRDAVTLERDEILFDKTKGVHRIVTSRQKTGTHVSVPIPPDVAQEILAVLNGNERYVFWNTGTGKEQSAVTNWQHELRGLFRGVFGSKTDFTPHCLRDTAAVTWLSKGIPMEVVSKLLGHTSIKTTERSYAKWDTRRQDNLDAVVTATW